MCVLSALVLWSFVGVTRESILGIKTILIDAGTVIWVDLQSRILVLLEIIFRVLYLGRVVTGQSWSLEASSKLLAI